jgi:hypothetical protein
MSSKIRRRPRKMIAGGYEWPCKCCVVHRGSCMFAMTIARRSCIRNPNKSLLLFSSSPMSRVFCFTRSLPSWTSLCVSLKDWSVLCSCHLSGACWSVVFVVIVVVLDENQLQCPRPSGPETNRQLVLFLIQLHLYAIPPTFPLLSTVQHSRKIEV